MAKMNVLGNTTWPADAVYNITGDAGGKCKGGADVEHHIAEGNIIWSKIGDWEVVRKDGFPILTLTSEDDPESTGQSVSVTCQTEPEATIQEISA
jgi:hypothetical protein